MFGEVSGFYPASKRLYLTFLSLVFVFDCQLTSFLNVKTVGLIDKERKITKVGWGIGGKIFVFNDFEQKLLEKNSSANFNEKKLKKFSTADFIEKNLKKNSTADFIEKTFVTFYRIFQEVKKKCQILGKFMVVGLPPPPPPSTQNLSHNG